MANQDLFKQAIAEAKSVREAAIINAKEALEETLTPHLKELLAAKLQEMDMADDEVNEMEDEMDEMAAKKGDEEKDLKEADDEEAEDDSEESEDEAKAEEEGEEKAEEEEELEVKDMEVEDLKNLIRDIVAQEMGSQGGEEMPADDMDMAMDTDAEAQPEEMVGADDEEINLEELLAELEQLAENKDDEEEDVIEEAKKKHKKEEKEEKEDKKAKEDLKEALATIETLRTELSEVNLLNAKLLYLNKVFRANNLTESQKVTVITSFDKAATVNEVKLVYETVKESFVSKTKSTIKESKGFASAPAGHSTKPAVIEQVDEQVLRMQKLAGIIR